MALGTYAELQSAVQDHLHRSDLSTSVVDLIKLGEVRLNREVRLLQQEEIATLACSTTTRFVTLPTGFAEAISLTLYSEEIPQALTPLSAEAMDSTISPDIAQPYYYRISNGNIEFELVADQAYVLKLRFIKKWDIATDLTNYLLTNHPDCYLYSALLASAPYIKDDNRIGVWQTMLASAIAGANRQDGRTRSKAILVSDPGLSGVGRYNILTDSPRGMLA